MHGCYFWACQPVGRPAAEGAFCRAWPFGGVEGRDWLLCRRETFWWLGWGGGNDKEDEEEG